MIEQYDPDTERPLEYVKETGDLPFAFVRIYSREHCAYWRGTGQGYTDNPQESTPWRMAEAFAKVKHAGPEKRIVFIKAEPVREALSALQAAVLLDLTSLSKHLARRCRQLRAGLRTLKGLDQ